jgi:hypothetical protein
MAKRSRVSLEDLNKKGVKKVRSKSEWKEEPFTKKEDEQLKKGPVYKNGMIYEIKNGILTKTVDND